MGGKGEYYTANGVTGQLEYTLPFQPIRVSKCQFLNGKSIPFEVKHASINPFDDTKNLFLKRDIGKKKFRIFAYNPL